MPKWFRKIVVTFVTIITLGTVVPSANPVPRENPNANLDVLGQNNPNGTSDSRHEVIIDIKESRKRKKYDWSTLVSESQDPDELIDLLSDFASEQAKEQGLKKFGPVIENRIGDTYNQTIVPKFSEAVAKIGQSLDYETLLNLSVSEKPSAGSGERILHFFDQRTGQELIKFHVRRDHPPKDGYWFNFHYHIAADNFQNHYEIGKIYWDKNMPPGWMA
ncbi:YpjP family protein [Pullulanibacillus sp. KACC 23026]|uniref:YpjP family protein n=1 Tax=Pullulanibacillus sp. KACC 23026 TaxID=3028315 RepID=UPI0023B0BFB7|nr:YpjP family protein [Pullulanibacillus sp. KACC 23026]WEG13744.1 YpjP family protein [Pullulanibacillus sp. KACC 23026]